MRRSISLLPILALVSGAPTWGAESDAAFVQKAANGGLLEVKLGDYAAANAADPEVRTFGKRMSEDHGKANQELAALAEREGMAVEKELDADHAATFAKLTAETGADFDRDYAAFMVSAHEQTISTFEAQASESKSEVDRWAAKTLPTLHSHLAMARDLDRRVNRPSGQADAPRAAPADARSSVGPQALP